MTGTAPTPRLPGKRIGILMESDFVEDEITYYRRRFAEEGAEVTLFTRLWGNPALTFTGHEQRRPWRSTATWKAWTSPNWPAWTR